MSVLLLHYETCLAILKKQLTKNKKAFLFELFDLVVEYFKTEKNGLICFNFYRTHIGFQHIEIKPTTDEGKQLLQTIKEKESDMTSYPETFEEIFKDFSFREQILFDKNGIFSEKITNEPVYIEYLAYSIGKSSQPSKEDINKKIKI